MIIIIVCWQWVRSWIGLKWKKYVGAFLVIIGLLIIVGTVICYLFYNFNSITMSAICGIVLVVMILLLYIRNYKNNHYGGTNSKMIFLMHINSIIIDCINLNSLNKRVSLVAVILFCNFGLSGRLDCCLYIRLWYRNMLYIKI